METLKVLEIPPLTGTVGSDPSFRILPLPVVAPKRRLCIVREQDTVPALPSQQPVTFLPLHGEQRSVLPLPGNIGVQLAVPPVGIIGLFLPLPGEGPKLPGTLPALSALPGTLKPRLNFVREEALVSLLPPVSGGSGAAEPKPFERADKPVERPKVDDGWTIARIAEEAPPPSWEHVFKEAKAELANISTLLEEDNARIGNHFVPRKCNVFRAFELTRLQDVRVVIWGQDPYHTILDTGECIAQGLSFSVPYGNAIPPSLQNIFKEIKNCYPDFQYPSHGCLDAWARQGVLLLNSSLTTQPGTAGAHSKYMLWMPFMARVAAAIAKVNPTCIHVMWGKEAQKVRSLGILGEKSQFLEASHPSPFSASRGFFGCKHFAIINKLLKGTPINWQL
ncbi:Uracil-DNA glycosylase [uncultured virus]|nr:Uracil-DNA glycosylase [uncultured virus]